MRIVAEGPDGSGKTTLIENLSLARIHLKSLRGGVGGTTESGWGDRDEAPTAYGRKLVEHPEGVAFDRFYMSEEIYGPLLRGGSAITSEEATLVRRLLLARGIPTIVCLPSYGTTLKNVMSRERPGYQTPEFLRSAYRSWHNVIEERVKTGFLPGVFHYDYTQDPVPPIISMPRMHNDLLIGTPGAKYLIVTADDLLYPTGSMRDLAASTLNRGLWFGGFREEEMSFTNARRWSGYPRGIRSAMQSSTQVIIAVGREAADYLAQAGVENGATDVPFVFTISDPRYTTVNQLTDTFRTIKRTTTV